MPTKPQPAPSPLALVQPVLARQNELVTWSQLIDAGVTKHQIARLVHRRLLERVRPRVYALVGSTPRWNRTLHAAVLSAGDDAMASHSSAAELWGFCVLPERRLEVTVPRTSCVHMNGVRVHRSLILPPEDRSERDGIPCASFARSLCDNSSALSQFQLSRVLDDGLRRDLVTLAGLIVCLERLESARGRSLARVRALVVERGPNFKPGGSRSELRVLEVLERAGLPLPVQQHRVRVGASTYFLDYAYPSLMTFIEYYELRSHSTPSSVTYDNDRLTALSIAGWKPLVFTDATPDQRIVDDVAAVFGLRDGSVRRRIGT